MKIARCVFEHDLLNMIQSIPYVSNRICDVQPAICAVMMQPQTLDFRGMPVDVPFFALSTNLVWHGATRVLAADSHM